MKHGKILSKVLTINTKTKWSQSGMNAEKSVIKNFQSGYMEKMEDHWYQKFAPSRYQKRDWIKGKPLIKMSFYDNFEVNILKEKWKITN